MLNRPAVILPPKVQAMMLQFEMLMNNPDLNHKYIADINNFRYKHLLENHSVNQETHSFATWMHLADRQDILDYIYLQINHNPFEHFFVLHWAVVCRQPADIIEILIGFNLKLYHVVYANGENLDTPLHLAVRENNPELAACMIDVTKNPDLIRTSKTSPLHLAVAMNNIEMARLLISKRAHLDLKDDRGNTPLHIAVRDGHVELAAELVVAGAGTLFQNSNGDTACHLALKKSKHEAERIFTLLGNQPNLGINTTDDKGETLFSLAAENGHIELVNRWLDAHLLADESERIVIDQANINRAFKAAVQRGQLDVVNALLPFIDNFQEECREKPDSALSIAARNKFPEIVRLLSLDLLTRYISERQDEPEYLKYTYFFVKKGQGFNKTHKIAAARALLEVLEGRTNVDAIKPEHYAALNNGRLRKIKEQVLKFCRSDYRPMIAAEQAAPTLNQLGVKGSRNIGSH